MVLGHEEGIAHPAQLTTPPRSHKTRLMPLLPVIASTVGGATNTPVPTILFKISALQSRQLVKEKYCVRGPTWWRNIRDDPLALRASTFRGYQGRDYQVDQSLPGLGAAFCFRHLGRRQARSHD